MLIACVCLANQRRSYLFARTAPSIERCRAAGAAQRLAEPGLNIGVPRSPVVNQRFDERRQYCARPSSRWAFPRDATHKESIHESLSDNPGPGGRSEEHTSELQSLMRISYAVF